MTDCIFCKIIQKAIPSETLYEDDKIVVIKDIFPKAPIHLLLLTKKHVDSLNALTEKDSELIAHLMLKCPQIAQAQGLTQGYRTVINTGRAGGQEVFHLHVHLLGGGNKTLPGFSSK
jgi:histidine triad (HIT) family protein